MKKCRTVGNRSRATQYSSPEPLDERFGPHRETAFEQFRGPLDHTLQTDGLLVVEDGRVSDDFVEGILRAKALLLHEVAEFPVQASVSLPPEPLEHVVDRTVTGDPRLGVVRVPAKAERRDPGSEEHWKPAHLRDQDHRDEDPDELRPRVEW